MSNRDPLESLIDYVGTVKPYHTKIYEVILDYAYAEPAKVTVKERYEIHTLMTTPEANKWMVFPDVGWDTGAWDFGQWDFPLESNIPSPSRIMAAVSERLKICVGMTLDDQIITYVDAHSLGWDTSPYDTLGFDAGQNPRLEIQQRDDGADAVGAIITESLTIEVI